MADELDPAAPAFSSAAPAQSDRSAPPSDAAADAELLTILSGGKPAAKAAVKPAKPRAAAAPEEDDDPEPAAEDPENEDLDDAPAAAAAPVAGEESDDDPAPELAEEPAAEDPDPALDDDDEETRASFTPQQQARFDKAMIKKARRITELKTSEAKHQARVTELEQQLTQARSAPLPAAPTSADDPLADVEDEAKLDARLTEQRKLRRFALRNPNGAVLKDDKGVEHEFSPERIGAILAETEEFIQEHAPARRQLLRDRGVFEAQAVTAFPWLKDKNSQGSIHIDNTLRDIGNKRLRDLPFIKLALADMLVGRNLRMAAAKKAASGPGGKAAGTQPPKAPATPGGAARPGRIPGKSKDASAAAKRLAQSGDDPGNAALRAIIG